MRGLARSIIITPLGHEILAKIDAGTYRFKDVNWK